MRNTTAGLPVALVVMLAGIGLGLFVACGPGSSSAPGDSGSNKAASSVPDSGASPAGVQDEKSKPEKTSPIDEVREQKAEPSQIPALPADSPDPETVLPASGSRELAVDATQFRQLLPRDAIAPVYEPLFAPAEFASLPPDELVIGVEINGESKAYPIGPLIFREMVNDTVGGVPVLVTW